MQLHKLHPDRASEMWPIIQQGVSEAEINPTMMIGHLMSGKSEVLLCQDPKCWFFFALHHSDLEQHYRVMRISAGWTLDRLVENLPLELMQKIHETAIGCGAKYLHFNDRSPFLMRFLKATGGEVWQRV